MNEKHDEQQIQPSQTSETKQKPRKRRRLLRWLLLLLLILAALAALAPTLASTRLGERLLEAMANRSFDGRIALGDLRLSWRGPCQLSRVELWDEQGRPTVRADSAQLSQGLWALAWRPDNVGSVDLARLDAWAYGQEEKKKEPTEIPDILQRLHLQLRLAKGRVEVTRADGRRLALDNITAALAMAGLGDITGELDFDLSSGKVCVSADVKGLRLQDGRVDLDQATGRVATQTEQAVKLDELGAFLGEQLTGQVDLTSEVLVEAGKRQGRLDASLTAVSAAIPGGQQLRPMDAAIKAQVTQAADTWSGNVDATGDVGELRLQGNYTPGRTFNPSELAAALLTGDEVRLAPFDLTGGAHVDLARLAQAVPGLLQLRPDVEVLAGEVTLDGLEAIGGDSPRAAAQIHVTGLQIKRQDSETSYNPITLQAALHHQAGLGLVVDQGSLDAPFARLSVQGNVRELDGRVTADLAELANEIRNIITVDDLELDGKLDGAFSVSRKDSEQFSGTWQANLTGLHYTHQGHRVEADQLASQGEAQLLVQDRQVQRLALESASIAVNNELLAQASGWWLPADDSFRVLGKLTQCDLTAVGAHAARWGVQWPQEWKGRLGGETTLWRLAKDQPIECEGHAWAQDLQRGDQVILAAGDRIEAQWTGLTLQVDQQALTLDEAVLAGLDSQAKVRNLKAAAGAARSLECQAEVQGGLTRWGTLAAAITDQDMPPMAGRVAWQGWCKTTGHHWEAAGEGQLDGLKVGTGSQALEEEQVAFAHAGVINLDSRQIQLSKAQIRSQTVRAELAGTIERYDEDCELDLNGAYEADWARLTQLVHEFRPATRDQIEIRGKTGGPLTLEGPFRKPGLTPEFRELTGGTQIGWETADLYGLKMKTAQMPVELAQGRLTVGPRDVEANGGKVRVGAVVDWTNGKPQIDVMGPATVVDAVQMDPEMGSELLSRFNPIFANVAGLEGRATLQLDSLVVPLGEEGYKRAHGAGYLDLADLRMAPAGILGEITGVLGAKTQDLRVTKVRRVDFAVRDGMIRYENFTVELAGLPTLRFSGAVGLDGRVDLGMSLPVTSGLLTRLGVPAPATDIARALEGITVVVPVRGTRQRPVLDFAAVGIDKLLQQANQTLIEQGLRKVLEGATRPRQPQTPSQPQDQKPNEPQQQQKPKDSQTPIPEAGEKILRDILQDILQPDKQRQNSKAQPNSQQ